jgi:hypothetical protein
MKDFALTPRAIINAMDPLRSCGSRPRERAAKKAAKRVTEKQPEDEDPAADGDEEVEA